eukprot:Lankesteria_metandrocarpae@DN3853_c0_g1_i1.p1
MSSRSSDSTHVGDSIGVTVEFNNVTLDVSIPGSSDKKFPPCRPKDTRRIIHGVSGKIFPGDLVALMGASGAGKSTLLNILSGRSSRWKGEVLINGVPATLSSIMRDSACFIQQEDMFYGNITVEEHLLYQSRLRIAFDEEKCATRVAETISLFGLGKSKANKIGNILQGTKKGISGGEKKRLSVASELLSGPALIFADEPTSGLDSFMAESIVDVLETLANKGKTVVATIHQPSYDVFEKFTKVLLLSEGHIVYFGPRKGVLPWFLKLGAVCPPFTNPGDFMVETLAIDPENPEKKQEELAGFVERWNAEGEEFNKLMDSDVGHNFEKSASMIASQATLELMKHNVVSSQAHQYVGYGNFDRPVNSDGSYKAVSFWRSWFVLFKRMMKNTVRDPVITRMRVAQSIFTALIGGFVYFRLSDDEWLSKAGGVFFITLQIAFQSVFNLTFIFVAEKPLMLRETEAGLYNTTTFFLARNIADIPLQIYLPILYGTISWFMMGLRDTAGAWLGGMSFCILNAFASGAIGYMCSCIAPSRSVALALAPIVLLPMMLVNPFYQPDLPDFWLWLFYLSPFTYSWKGLMYYVFHDAGDFGGPDCETGSLTFCSGNEILAFYNVTSADLWSYYFALFCLLVGFRVLSAVALWATARKKQND